MIRKILKTDNARLRETSRPVGVIDKKILNLIQDLKDTLSAQKDPEGVGLAAPQIGKNLRLFVMLNKKEIRVVINPEIASLEPVKETAISNEKKDSIMEGCLSLPHYYGPLVRTQKLTLRYKTPEGEEKVEIFEGFTAQIIQHEVDHLNGILFVDRLLEQKKQLYKQEGDEWVEVDI